MIREDIIMINESEKIELKEILVDEVKKEIVAFANSEGGKIYIGIKDDGTVVGLDNPEEISLQATNMIRDAIKPDVTMFAKCSIASMDDKEILVIDVEQGTNKPYYIARNGMKPSGVFLRQGVSSAPASEDAIRQMIKETDGDIFENMRSMNQELTFGYAKKIFEEKNLEFTEMQYQTLGIVNQNLEYTNLGLLLSDQCPYSIKCAVFADEDSYDFQDRNEFSGSVLKQLNDTFEFIKIHNRLKSTFEGLYRIDQNDFPEGAVREALLNCIVHRDYAYSASTQVRIYPNKLEFVSVGGLLKGISLEDVLAGLSICRNKKLADLFFRLKLIESYGTGLGKIENAYKTNFEKPSIVANNNSFKIELPALTQNIIAESDNTSDYENKIIMYANKHGMFSRVEMEKLLNLSQATVNRILKAMVIEGKLKKEGNGKNTRYKLI